MGTIDHLEETLADSYRKEIDQEENVWRSLPFFAATLALQLAAVVGVAEKLPPLGGPYLWWTLVPVGLAAAATLATLLFMAAAIAPARFRYIAPEPDLRDYALRLDRAELAHPEIAAAVVSGEAAGGPQPGHVAVPRSDALSVLKGELVRQYALATHHNRLINQRRSRLRGIAGLCMLGSVLATLVLVGVTVHHHMRLDRGAGTSPPLSGVHDHGTEAERQERRVPDGHVRGSTTGGDDRPRRQAPADPGQHPGDARGPQGLVDEQRAPGAGGGVREGGP